MKGEKMPTGYTAFIEDGEITTGKDFLILCLRNFGICAGMRDEPFATQIPEKFEVDSYHENQLIEANKKLELLAKITDDEILDIINKKCEQDKLDKEKRIKDDNTKLSAYQKIYTEIEAWIPPTDEHIGVKEFALNQIKICVDDINNMQEYYIAETKQLTVSEWREVEKKCIQCDIEYHSKKQLAEIERTASKNKWLKDFRDSLLQICSD